MNEEPAPILRVTVGAPVYTQDERKIGKVKDVRGQAFQVETGMFKRDYWLASEAIGDAAPEQAVILAVDEGELDSYKLDDAAAA
jgi:hypothetical protein